MKLLNHNFVKNTEAALLDIIGEPLSGQKIIAGLSGGADSTALVLALYALSEKHGFQLVACHVNHMIRGKEADRDEDFSRSLCERYGIPFEAVRIDVPSLARSQKKGIEEAARDARYGFFEKVRGSDGFVATAHTASDNAETVLFNIIRGCGINGLCGIPKRRDYIIRPILFAERSDVEGFLSDIGEGFVTDSTNLGDDCTRNIIRHSIIPVISGINPSYARSFSNLSELANRDCEYLEKAADKAFSDEISVLATLDISLRSRIISDIYRKKSGTGLASLHTDMLCREIERMHRERDGKSRQYRLPGGFTAHLSCGRLSIEPTVAREPCDEEYDIPISLGTTVLCGGRFLVCVSETDTNAESIPTVIENNQNVYTFVMEARLFGDIINNARLRSGRSGDKIRISGMSKEVRKLYSAKKIPINLRWILPRICDGESGEILALPYVGLCDSQHGHYEEATYSVRLYNIKE